MNQVDYLNELLKGKLSLDKKLQVDPSLEILAQNVAAPQIQRQPVTEIQAEVPFVYSTVDAVPKGLVTAPAANVLAENIDNSMQKIEAEALGREADVRKAEEKKNQLEDEFLSAARRLRDAPSRLEQVQQNFAKTKALYNQDPREFAPPQQDLLSQAIASLGPALAGILVGGDAGLAAGGKGGEQSIKGFQALKDQEAKNRAAMSEQQSKRLVGLGELTKAESEAASKAEQDAISKADKYLKAVENAYGKNSAEYKTAFDAYQDFTKAVLLKNLDVGKDMANITKEGLKIENQNQMDRYKQEMANKRAAIAAAAAAKRQQDKPLTEGQAKAAFNYAQAGQANEDLRQIAKAYGALPSTAGRFYPFFKQLSQGEYTDIGATVFGPEIPEPVREQVASEILFLEAIGRAASGAAISSTEWRNFEGQYFPRLGDNEATIKRKENARNRAVEVYRIQSGRGAEMVPSPAVIPSPAQPKPQAQQDKAIADYAKKYNLSYEKAKQIIEKRRTAK